MSRKISGWWFFFIFSLLFVAAVWIPKVLFQTPTGIYVLILMLVFIILGPLILARGLQHVRPTVWLAAGLLELALLVVPTYLQVEHLPYDIPGWLRPLASTVLFLAPSLALIGVALLIYTGIIQLMRPASTNQTRVGVLTSSTNNHTAKPGWIAAIAWLLAAVLVARTLYNFYWLIVWDSTYDPIDILWLAIPIYAALFSTVVLIIALPRWAKLAGLYGLIVPAILIATMLLAKRVDFRQLTITHAEQVSQAIEAYYAREGYYPQTLSQLFPREALSIPSPVIINGISWCYDSSGEQLGGSGAFYRLGYVDRRHWSDPNLFGHLYQAVGNIADLPPLCAGEISEYMLVNY